MMENSNQLDIRYLNVRGLSANKLSLFCQLCNFDLAFLAETWYLTYQRHPHPEYTLVGSTVVTRIRTDNRQQGGIYCYIRRSLLPALSSFSEGIHHLSVSIFETTIVAVYLPPSLKGRDLENALADIPKADVYIGDWNIRLGALVNDTETGPVDRVRTISQFVTTRSNASLRVPIVYEEPVRVDHVFASPHVVGTVRVLARPVLTDHPMLAFELKVASSSTNSNGNVCGTVSRFLTKSLENPGAKDIFVSMVASHCWTFLGTSWDNASVLNTVIVSMLQSCLELTVGSYDPNAIQHTADWTQTNILNESQPISNATATRLLARSFRSNGTRQLLQSSDSTKSAEEEARDHFIGLFKLDAPVSIDDLQHSLPIVDPLQRLSVPSSSQRLLPSGGISVEEISQAIVNYPSAKSPGMDGIDARVLKALNGCKPFLCLLSRFFSLCYISGQCPSQWNESVIYPLVKPGKDIRFIADRRPVALTAMLRRVFEKCILARLESLLVFNSGQAGFRRGFSTLSQVLLAAESSQRGMHNKVFIDLSSAYDKVLLPRLWRKLELKQVVPGFLITVLQSLFDNCLSYAVVNGSLVGPISRERGLFQGSILSPILFNVYINDLAEMLNQGNNSPVPKALLYADDILIQHHDKDVVQQMLQQVDSWCQLNGMTVNIGKCGTFPGRLFTLAGQKIPEVTSYKYLGIPHNQTGLDLVEMVTLSSKKALGFLKMLEANTCSWAWPTHVKIFIYRTFIRPIAEYGAPLMYHVLNRPETARSNSLWQELEKVQKASLTWIFSRKGTTSLLRSIAGLEPLKTRFSVLALLFVRHLRSLDGSHPLHSITNSGSTCWLIKDCLKHPDIEWLLLPKPTLRKKIDTLRWSTLESGRLSKYVLDSCRNKIGLDCFLFIPDAQLRQLALKWRTNAVGSRMTCSVCHCRFTRAHIIRCSLITISDCEALFWSSFLSTQEDLGPDDHYTPLDHCLNLKKYSEFKEMISTVADKIN